MIPNDFLKSLSNEQKAALLGSLAVIAKSDGDINLKEKTYLEEISELIRIQANETSVLLNDPKFDFLVTLKTLDEGTIDWYVFTVFELILIDGPAKEVEILDSINLCKLIGVSEEKFYASLNKTLELAKLYLK
jgi:hypothetical protein